LCFLFFFIFFIWIFFYFFFYFFIFFCFLFFCVPFFFRASLNDGLRPIFWRAKLTAHSSDLERAAVRLKWLKETVDYLGGYFDFPCLRLLTAAIPNDPTQISSDLVEQVADEVRNAWGVKRGPMPDLVEKLEESGVLVSRIHVGAEKVDAFSQWSDRFRIPFIVLSRDKASAVRQRFDAAHELAHIILHQKVTEKHLNNQTTYKFIEKQADAFASYILLPERDFLDELYSPTLDGFLSLKERWGVSVAAMIMRSRALDLLDDASAKRMWMNYTRRGWRKGEPLDGKLVKESPYLIRRSFEMLIDERVQSPSDIWAALPFPVSDLEEIADLEPGTLGGPVTHKAEPTFKGGVRSAGNVISLSDRRR
jgi:Zn-dependent peptidase ImmA (M78 family)